ncbi:MAG: hypothetical protein KDF24_00090 [Rhodocyclaceae bacterium]|nr:hypothetical protein [Rhodocyclaceae bacterium]MCB1961561.1 hypothetical protein [Rhodocyclaceae bacterium]
MTAAKSLTICTVSFGHGALIELNLQLARAQNPQFDTQAVWQIADNAPIKSEQRIVLADPSVVISTGACDTSQGASHHHALALNALVGAVDTRFLLVLDPDFYLLMPNWIERVLGHMQAHQLAFFGAPWHPRYNRNYRYFPAVHCMFVDLERVERDALDFRPRLDLIEPPLSHRTGWLDRLPFLWRRKRVAWDTGVQVHARFAETTRAQCVTPVFRQSSEAPVGFKTRLIEALLPDAYCYTPKRKGSYTERGFCESGACPHPLPALWEETLWDNEPFGLHVRRSYAAHGRNENDEWRTLLGALDSLTARGRKAGLTR